LRKPGSKERIRQFLRAHIGQVVTSIEGRPVDDRPGFWVFETDPQGDTPSFRVLYEYLPKKHQVRLKAITVAHLVEDEE